MKKLEGCAPRCAQMLLIVLNAICFLTGAGLIALGIWVITDEEILEYMDFFSGLEGSGNLLKVSAIVLIVVGLVVLIMAFFGCCGAIKQSKIMLSIYIILLCMVLLVELAVGILGIVFKEKIIEYIDDEFRDTVLKEWSYDGDSAFQQAVEYIQFESECCAWTNATYDYGHLIAKEQIPVSCCVLKEPYPKNSNDLRSTDAVDYEKCNTYGDDSRYRYTVTCQDDLKEFVDDNTAYIIGAGIGIACFQLFSFIFAVCVCQNV